MGWEVHLFRPIDLERFHLAFKNGEVPEDLLLSIGNTTVVRERLLELFPHSDWSDPTWGDLAEDGYSVEFALGSEEVLTELMLVVRGSGNPISLIANVSKTLECIAFDSATGDPIQFEARAFPAGWQDLQEWIDNRDDSNH